MGPDQPHQPVVNTPQHLPPKNKSKGKKMLMWLVMLLVIAGAAAAGYYYRDMETKDQQKQADTAEIAALKAQNTKLKKDLAAAKAASSTTAKPSQEDLDNIEAAVKSGNYAALEQLMADKVTVIIAASEGLGERTDVQAVADLKYLDTGTDPWDFALPAATLTDYKDGDYAKYFPDGVLVGKSANGYVVGFSFDSNGKISTIFMASSGELL